MVKLNHMLQSELLKEHVIILHISKYYVTIHTKSSKHHHPHARTII